ncbi:MAG TPA: tripartite tricarboxylate transporter substrate binding protein [Bordetella sp.]
MRFIRSAALLAPAFCAVLLAPSGQAQAAYPDKPIKIIVPFTPGGTSDVLTRTVGEQLGKDLGQSVVVENRAGAGGALGAGFVARAEPDGYTLLMGSSSGLAVNPGLFSNLPYDPEKSFTPISMVAGIQNILLVNPSLPIKTVPDLIAYGKQHPLFFASAGIGSSPHMSAEVFEAMSGLKMTHVPFKGGPESLSEVISGRVNLVFDNMPTAAVMVKSGQLRGVAVTGLNRSPMVPDLPTIDSQGLPGYNVTVWYGLVAPAGTPPAIIALLSGEVAKILARPEIKAKLIEIGTEPASSTPAEFKALIASERAKWADVIKKADIKVMN